MLRRTAGLKKVNPKPTKLQQKMVIKRSKRIKHVLDILPETASLKTVRPSSLPFMPLWVAYRQFIWGYFESSILNSTFAVEYALLVRLDKKLSPTEKEKISKRGLTFYDSINRSKTLLDLDNDLITELKTLCNLRNMNAHPSSWVALYKLLDGEDSFLRGQELTEWVSSVTKKNDEEIANEVKEQKDALNSAFEKLFTYKEKYYGELPNLLWAVHKTTLDAQAQIVKSYSEKLVKDLINERKIYDIINKPKKAAAYIQRNYPYPEELAFRSIDTAAKVIIRLNF
ncbi:MAG: hypothetical protein NWE93_06700 [Candidatus Bathyarchaeota archaeon]|nr:hypothetical protein [Candidatus Bathyarchaeota archaeon]